MGLLERAQARRRDSPSPPSGVRLPELLVAIRGERTARDGAAAGAVAAGAAAAATDLAIEERKRLDESLRKLQEELTEREAILRVEAEKLETERRELDGREQEVRRLASERDDIERQRKTLQEKESGLAERLRDLERREQQLASRGATDAVEKRQRQDLEKVHREMTAKAEELARRESQLTRSLGEKERNLTAREADLRALQKKAAESEAQVRLLQKEVENGRSGKEQAAVQKELEGEISQLTRSRDEFRMRESNLKLEVGRRDARIAELEATAKERLAPVDPEDLKLVLRTLDGLLEQLPDDVVQRFLGTKEFKKYDQLLNALGIGSGP